jgi:hypothetical protein
MRKITLAFVSCLFVLAAHPAFAEIWDTYAPSKHVWRITRVRIVEPNKIDDYVSGLHKSYVPVMEIAKRNGSVIDYHILINQSRGSSEANVVFLEEFSSWGALEPDKDRDLKARAELRQNLPKDQVDKMVDEYNKYRTFLDQSSYWSVEYLK